MFFFYLNSLRDNLFIRMSLPYNGLVWTVSSLQYASQSHWTNWIRILTFDRFDTYKKRNICFVIHIHTSANIIHVKIPPEKAHRHAFLLVRDAFVYPTRMWNDDDACAELSSNLFAPALTRVDTVSFVGLLLLSRH